MKKIKIRLFRIILGSALLTAAVLINSNSPWISITIFCLSYIAAGGDILLKALKNIVSGHLFDENFLMTIATIGAFIIGEFHEGIAVMLFYQAGELFQSFAVDKSRKSIANLMDIRPDFASVKRDGQILVIDPDEALIDDIIVIKPGERVPLDAVVTDGASMLDTSALTGESVPREVSQGCEILSGCINLNGLIYARVTREYGESTVSKILDLVENAAVRKAKTESFITRFAKYYTPAVVLLAALISVLPPLIFDGQTFSDWVYRGLTFLVISCPCALVVSIPLGFFGGIGGASRKGILIKGGNYLEALSQLETVVFDKTGTLTKGVFDVQEICCAGVLDKNTILELAAYAESFSNHPISISLKRAYNREIDSKRISETEEIPGHGVRAVVENKTVLAGNEKLMTKMNIPCSTDVSAGTIVHIAVDNEYAGYIVISDELKEDSRAAIRQLREIGVRNTVMLTGDTKSAAEKAARELGLDTVYYELLPGDKVEKLELLLLEKSARGKLAFVGDGINDAPVLARSDVGIAMGGLGSDAAIEAADVVIMTDEPSKIASGIRISKKTLGIIRQNIVFSLGIKLTVLILAALGFASMWGGVVADVGVTVLAVLNASRSLNVKKL